MKTAKTAPADTRFKAGNKANPGGLTVAEREARDAIRQALAGDLREVGLAAYKRLLEADNPAIVVDFMNRLAGKVKERLEISEDPESAEIAGASVSEILSALAIVRAKK